MPEMDYSKLLGRIRERGMTQRTLAQAIGISESQISLKLKGAFPFKQQDIRNICDCLKIEPDEIGAYFFTPKLEESQDLRKEETV